MSMAIALSGVSSRRERASSRSIRSWKPRRLSSPVSGSRRASEVSRWTISSRRAVSACTTAATTSTEPVTSIQRSRLPIGPVMVVSATPWTSPIHATMKIVPLRP